MRAALQQRIMLDDRLVVYSVIVSKTARKLRVRVSSHGIEVVKPASRNLAAVAHFMTTNKDWLVDQIGRAERLQRVRKPEQLVTGTLSFHGEPTRIQIEPAHTRFRGNVVKFVAGKIVIWRGRYSRTPIERSLENWLRKQARAQIEDCLQVVTGKLRRVPHQVYVMGQRTKWGNCSSRRNLSFNWRLVLAPNFVTCYLVTNEAVHLAVPDHSAKFWLTLQSLCPEMERAKQWLAANGPKLSVNLKNVAREARGLRRLSS